MKIIKLSKIFLIVITPLLIFLSAIQFAGFNDSFYKEEFSKHKVQEKVPEYSKLHNNVMDFIKGRSDYLPDNFDEREKKHLWDVRKLVLFSEKVWYFSIFLFIILIIAHVRQKETRRYLKEFIGKIFLFGGFLTTVLAILFFLLMNSNFTPTFEYFHKIFFQQGTYSFDPETEIIVSIYPEALFMDLGLKIAKFVAIASFICIIAGIALMPRNKKNKYIKIFQFSKN